MRRLLVILWILRVKRERNTKLAFLFCEDLRPAQADWTSFGAMVELTGLLTPRCSGAQVLRWMN
jgi:hypothetical protein